MHFTTRTLMLGACSPMDEPNRVGGLTASTAEIRATPAEGQ